jgi:hypothetical protein
MTKSQVCVAATGRECFFTRVQYMLTPDLSPFVCPSFPLDSARALSVMFTNLIMATLSWSVPWVWEALIKPDAGNLQWQVVTVFPLILSAESVLCFLRSSYPHRDAAFGMWYVLLFFVFFAPLGYLLYLPLVHSFISLCSGWYTARHDMPSDIMQRGKGWEYVLNVILSLLSRMFTWNTVGYDDFCKTLSPLSPWSCE